jgi:hypothetical protein
MKSVVLEGLSAADGVFRDFMIKKIVYGTRRAEGQERKGREERERIEHRTSNGG